MTATAIATRIAAVRRRCIPLAEVEKRGVDLACGGRRRLDAEAAVLDQDDDDHAWRTGRRPRRVPRVVASEGRLRRPGLPCYGNPERTEDRCGRSVRGVRGGVEPGMNGVDVGQVEAATRTKAKPAGDRPVCGQDGAGDVWPHDGAAVRERGVGD